MALAATTLLWRVVWADNGDIIAENFSSAKDARDWIWSSLSPEADAIVEDYKG